MISIRILSVSLLGLLSLSAWADPLASVDFSTYTDGALAGQGGWLQYNTQSTNEITVTNGQVSWAAGSTANDQDVMLSLGTQFSEPASGVTTLYFALELMITGAGDVPSYFAALNAFTDTTTSSNYQNARLAALDSGDGGFYFGTRVNGQAGYPYVYGSEKLEYNTTYVLLAEINLVAGAQNDIINLYVAEAGATLNLSSVYATATYTSGAATDPLYGAVLLSQYGTTSTDQAGVVIDSLIVSENLSDVTEFYAVPEPGMFASLAGLFAMGLVCGRRRRV